MESWDHEWSLGTRRVEKVEEGVWNWWARMCHTVGSLAVPGSRLWSLVSLFRGGGVGCEVVVGYGQWLGYGIAWE